ncbi:hypothetical protein ES705_30105 [subsurface metagenome]
MSGNNITPFEATHPGILLQDELKARNKTKGIGIRTGCFANLPK